MVSYILGINTLTNLTIKENNMSKLSVILDTSKLRSIIEVNTNLNINLEDLNSELVYGLIADEIMLHTEIIETMIIPQSDEEDI